MYTRYTFAPVKHRRIVKTHCTKCKKRLRRVLTETWYRNGLHDERKTAAECNRNLDAEKARLEREGTLCRNCE